MMGIEKSPERRESMADIEARLVVVRAIILDSLRDWIAQGAKEFPPDK